MLKLALTALRKIEDGAIINFNKNKEEKYINLLKNIISLNNDIIYKSSDSENQIGHLKQLRKNASFLFKNEKILKLKSQSIIEQYISSLNNLLRKNLDNEDLCFAIIETFIVLSNYYKEIYNLLVKGGCSKLILQFLELTNNSKLCYNSVQLLKNICLSKQENLMLLANQNILITLFEIRTKFVNEKKITQCIDEIVNEIMKLPGQGIHIEEILIDAIKDFHENMKQNFSDENIKIKLLNYLIIINSYTTNKTQIKNLFNKKEFIQDFILCVKQTLETKESSQIIEKLFTCQVEIIKKLKDEIPIEGDEEQDKINQTFCYLLLNILFHKSIFSESFLLTANTLLYYIKNNILYDKFLSNKIDEKFIEQLLEQEENYLDNPQISKVINNILSYLALKNPKFAKYIVRKGGLVNIIDDLKNIVNLNDENSKLIKCNGLIMINSLLNEKKNMEIFIHANGIELINNIIRNEILLKQKKENQFTLLEEQYKTICCINLDTEEKPENIIKENNINNKQLDQRKSSIVSNDIIIRENSIRGSLKLFNKLSNEINPENIDNIDLDIDDYDYNNYIIYCMEIINKGLSQNKNEFIDKNTLYNLIKIAEYNFPEKYIFSQLAEFLSFYIKIRNNIQNEEGSGGNQINEENKDEKENEFKQYKKIIKISLSNRAFFYSNDAIVNKAKEIENQIGALVLESNEYISEYKKVLSQKYNEVCDINLKYKLLTYLSLIIDLPLFKNICEQIRNEIISFYDGALSTYLIAEKNQIIINLDNNKISNFSKQKDGILLSLIKVYNYFIEQNIIDKNNQQVLENIENFEKIGNSSYIPENYLFVHEFEKEISKLIEQTSGYILSQNLEKDIKHIKYTNTYLIHLQNIFNKVMGFIEDFCKYIKLPSFTEMQKLNEKKEDNLDNVLILLKKYFKTDEDKEKKEESCQILFDAFMNILEILFEEEIYEIYTKNGRIYKRLKLLWKLIYYSILNDNNNKILEKISKEKLNDIIEKIKNTIIMKDNNKPSLRKIPLIISKKIEGNSGNNEIYQILYQFVCDDLNNYGKTDEKIKKIDLEILSFLSQFHSQMKQILSNINLWKFLKDEYSRNDLSNDERLQLAIIFKNATKNKTNLDNLIKNDSHSIQIIFSKVLKDTIKTLDNNGKIIAETEMESVCNIIKNKNNLSIIQQKNIVNNEELKKIETIYDSLDSNLSLSFKSILNEIAVDEKLQKNLKSVNEDEEKINELEQIVMTNYEKHVLEFMKYYDRNKKEESLLDSIVKDELLTEGKKKIIGINDIKEENQTKEKIITPLSIKTNDKMYQVLTQILLILIKNYNLLNSFKEDLYNAKRIVLINKSLNLLQKISLSQDNHERILEDGLINLLEKMCEDYKNDKAKGVNDDNNYISLFISKGKFILKECSQSENAISIILDSPIFQSIVSEIMELNENLKIMNNNSNIKKIFIYDTAIITNICIISKSYEQIINKLGINTILKLGIRTGNIILLESIINILNYYIEKNESKLNEEFYGSVFSVMEKCIRNKNRSSILMSKTLNLAVILYTPNNSQKIDKLKLLESIHTDIELFSLDEEYIISALICLCTLVKNNPQNIDECFEIGLVKKVKKIIFELTKDIPENYSKILFKLTEFYYNLIKTKPENSGKFCEYDITRNVVKYIDTFNNQIKPKSEQEKEIEIQQNQFDMINNNIIDESIKNGKNSKLPVIKHEENNINNKENKLNEESLDKISLSSNKEQQKNIKINFNRGIMMNCINFLDIITTIPEANNYISSNTSFNKYIILAIQNDNNDNNFLIVALHCLGNYILSEAGDNFLKTKIIDMFILLRNLQSQYYSNSGILININYISGSIINSEIDKKYIIMFFDLVAESIKCQEWNSNLIKSALKIMDEGLDKKPFIIDSVNDQLISSIIYILKVYKDKYDIQLLCYKILSFFATDKHVEAFSVIIKELLQQIKNSLSNLISFNKDDKDKNMKEKIKKAINNLILFLGNIDQYYENITNELIIPFIKELMDYGIDEESNGTYILNILDNLFKNKVFIEPFVVNKGIDSLIKIMKTIDNNYNNVYLILQLFSIIKKILIVNDEYKLKMQELKMPDIINRVIKYTSTLDKKIEFEGKSLLFLIKMANSQLEKVEEVDFTEIKIIEPIKPEVKNFLTSGKQVKIINEHGEIKEMQLLFSQDLLKVHAKLIKSNLPPKPKYVIETNNIKAILKGYGTDAFKKSGGLFRSAPKPELCFSIIGPKTEDGTTKSLNAVCKSEKDVDRWIRYLEDIIIYFQKKKFLGNITIDKKIRK